MWGANKHLLAPTGGANKHLLTPPGRANCKAYLVFVSSKAFFDLQKEHCHWIANPLIMQCLGVYIKADTTLGVFP